MSAKLSPATTPSSAGAASLVAEATRAVRTFLAACMAGDTGRLSTSSPTRSTGCSPITPPSSVDPASVHGRRMRRPVHGVDGAHRC